MPTPANPYKRSTPAAASSKPKARTKAAPRHGPAQGAFISLVRKRVEAESRFFEKNDWCRIPHTNRSLLASTAKISADAFYVKDVAMWVPHLIVKDYIPSCKSCGLTDAVDCSKFNWIENPKTLYGTNSHWYFDTMYYFCNRCKCDFAGWHESTLTTDADEIAGVINFRMSKGFAVDEDQHLVGR